MRFVVESARTIGPTTLVGGIVTAFALCSGAPADAQTGSVRCIVTENGSPATGTIGIERDGREIAGGPCGTPIKVPIGKWRATARLDGTLDNPAKRIDVVVTEGKTTTAQVDFPTGELEVRIETKGGAGTAIVTVNRGTHRVGTLGAGVAAKISAGNYEVIVRYSGKERRYEIDLRPGQRRLIRARF